MDQLQNVRITHFHVKKVVYSWTDSANTPEVRASLTFENEVRYVSKARVSLASRKKCDNFHNKNALVKTERKESMDQIWNVMVHFLSNRKYAISLNREYASLPE